MGNLISRQGTTTERAESEPVTITGTASRLFDSNQTYFGPRFMISDETPSTSGNISRAFWEEIIAVLRGGLVNMDDLSVFGNLHDQLPPADLKMTTTLQSRVALLKESLRLNGTETGYTLDFKFDTIGPCMLKIYWAVKEKRASNMNGSISFQYVNQDGVSVAPWSFGPFSEGLDQHFELPVEYAFDPSDLEGQKLAQSISSPLTLRATPVTPTPASPEPTQTPTTPMSPELATSFASTVPLMGHLAETPRTMNETPRTMTDTVSINMHSDPPKPSPSNEGAIYPLVIILESISPDDSKNNKQTTFITLTHTSDGYDPKIVKQTAQIDGFLYLLQDIYGFAEAESKPSTEQLNSNSKECIICLSDAKDTIVLPCRHLCICHKCADVLRLQNQSRSQRSGAPKCPICRQVFHSLLQVTMPPPFQKRDSVASARRAATTE